MFVCFFILRFGTDPYGASANLGYKSWKTFLMVKLKVVFNHSTDQIILMQIELVLYDKYGNFC